MRKHLLPALILVFLLGAPVLVEAWCPSSPSIDIPPSVPEVTVRRQTEPATILEGLPEWITVSGNDTYPPTLDLVETDAPFGETVWRLTVDYRSFNFTPDGSLGGFGQVEIDYQEAELQFEVASAGEYLAIYYMVPDGQDLIDFCIIPYVFYGESSVALILEGEAYLSPTWQVGIFRFPERDVTGAGVSYPITVNRLNIRTDVYRSAGYEGTENVLVYLDKFQVAKIADPDPLDPGDYSAAKILYVPGGLYASILEVGHYEVLQTLPSSEGSVILSGATHDGGPNEFNLVRGTDWYFNTWNAPLNSYLSLGIRVYDISENSITIPAIYKVQRRPTEWWW